MIDETLRNYLHEVDINRSKYTALNVDCFLEVHQEALTAIYEIGLEAIPKTYEPMWKGHEAVIWKDGYDTCRAEFLKAWAKACGVAE